MDSPKFWVADLDDHATEKNWMSPFDDYTEMQARSSTAQTTRTIAQAYSPRVSPKTSLLRPKQDIALESHTTTPLVHSQVHRLYTEFSHNPTNAVHRTHGRLTEFHGGQAVASKSSFSIYDLYHNTLRSLAHLVASLNCAQCDESYSKLELREVVTQLHIWAQGLDLHCLEQMVDRDTGLQLLVIRKLSNIIYAEHNFRGYRSECLSTSKCIQSLIRRFSHEHLESDADCESADSSDSEDDSRSSEAHLGISGQHREHLKHLNLLKMNVASLMNLLPTIDHCCQERQSLQLTVRASKLQDHTKMTTLASPFVIQIQDKFRLIDPILAHRLGEANWSRFHRLGTLRDCFEDTDPDNHLGWLSDPEEMVGTDPNHAIIPSMFYPASQFNDSGLGSSLPNKSLYAPSNTSHRSMISTKSAVCPGGARVPTTPPEVFQGLPFNFKICGRRLTGIRDRIDWKLHVFADLQPYVCLFEDCKLGNVTFSTRKKWADHDINEHRQQEVWQCFNCDTALDTRDGLLNHCRDQHNFEMSSQLAHRAVMLDAARTTVTNISSQKCPMCYQRQFKHPHEWTLHISRHMEDVALSALPQSTRVDDDDDADDDDNDENSEGKGRRNEMLNYSQTVGTDTFGQYHTNTMSISHQAAGQHLYNLKAPSEPPMTDFMYPVNPLSTSMPHYAPISQEPHFEGDIYTPRYKRRNAAGKWEGWCGYCEPGRWLDLKNSRYWEDKLRNHGINARTKTFFENPVRMRWTSDTEILRESWVGDPDANLEEDCTQGEGGKREGLCHRCNSWVPVDGMRTSGRKRFVAWWMHAYKCHERS